MADLPTPDQNKLADSAAKIGAAPAAVGEEAVAAALEGAQPVDAAAAKPAAPASSGTAKSKGGKRGKGVFKIVDEMLASGHFLTDRQDNVYRFDEARGFWQMLTEAELLALAFRQDKHSTAAKRVEIIKRLRAATLDGKLKWGRVAECEIPCANGIVDVLTWEKRAHRPEDRLERTLPVEWLPEDKAKCPVWDKALDYWFPKDDDGGRREALQDFFGYICLAHAKYKKCLVLFGDSDTGKSVPAMLARALVGEEYTCRLSVDAMDDPVRLALIKGKALNIMTELSAEAMIADGGFKTLVSTEEPIDLNPKYKDPETYLPAIKIVIVTNNLPRLNDHTAATFNRLYIVPFDRVVTGGDQNRDLLEDLKQELPGILRWAAIGARRLVDRHGQWPEIEAAKTIMTGYRDEMNPMRQFIRERLIRDDNRAVPLFRLTEAYNRWNMGAKNTGVKGVGKLLRAAGMKSSLKIMRIKGEGRQLTSLIGFRLSEAPPNELVVGPSTEIEDEVTGLEIVEVATSENVTTTAGRAMDMNDDSS